VCGTQGSLKASLNDIRVMNIGLIPASFELLERAEIV
jgi:hypothetical protein